MFQFQARCFGLSTAPYVFTRFFKAVSILAHQQGIRLFRYLDDWLIASDSREQSLIYTEWILDLGLELGMLVNFEKSDLIPSRVFTFLGMQLDMGSFLVRPAEHRLSKFEGVLKLFFHNHQLSATVFLRLIGHMVSLEKRSSMST